ncbi:phytase [Georgenia sp. EYE_87]|uniref:phytase n=1 Tax=Georgenia sp. EYE_87 TaxID=2853448 RepID=UPI0020036D20|nr:phytase [Georgenia sp. EYE_87]MCK6212554.1 phytase [Georgenia sp. EYE_87]
MNHRITALASSLALLVALAALGVGVPTPAAAAVAVPAADETPDFPAGSGDIADDPAIWVDRAAPSRSVVVGSSKDHDRGGLSVYDLAGRQLQFLETGEMNNVDLRSGVLGGRTLVAASDRTDDALAYFFLDPRTRTLSPAGSTPLGFEPYGTCLYASPDGAVYAFVTEATDSAGQFDQYRLSLSGASVTGTKVRDLTTGSQAEGCAVDDQARRLFLSEEEVGLFSYGADPTASPSRTAIDLVSGPRLRADVEGVTVAHGVNGGASYLLVSSQGDSTYHVYDLAPPHTHRRAYTVTASGAVDGATGTDGQAVTLANLGPQFPGGLVVVHDQDNAGGSTSNFKYVDARKALGPLHGVRSGGPATGFFLNDSWGPVADHVFQYGRLTDRVLIGDWDGDGDSTIMVRRGNRFYVSNELRGGQAQRELVYGRPGDEVLVGDWDGDGRDTLAVRRGSTYYVKNTVTSGPADRVVVYGRARDQVLVGDWDGDGRDTLAVRRGSTYYVKNTVTSGPADRVVVYGRARDQVLVGDWDRDGRDTLAVRRGSTYYVKNTVTAGPADRVVVYGRPGDEVYVGDWDGDGTDTLGLRRLR